MKTKTKITKIDVADVLNINLQEDDALSLSKGVFTLRHGYYWRPKLSSYEWFLPTIERLKTVYDVMLIDTGDHWAVFQGGEGIRKNSHYWAKFTCKPKE